MKSKPKLQAPSKHKLQTMVSPSSTAGPRFNHDFNATAQSTLTQELHPPALLAKGKQLQVSLEPAITIFKANTTQKPPSASMLTTQQPVGDLWSKFAAAALKTGLKEK